MIPLPKPPIDGAPKEQWRTWFETAWRVISPRAQRLVGDQDGDIDAATTYAAILGPITAPRTFTLPPWKAVAEGSVILVQDEAIIAGVHNLTIAARGSDNVDGGASAVITINAGRQFIARGVKEGQWWSGL